MADKKLVLTTVRVDNSKDNVVTLPADSLTGDICRGGHP